ncbi:Uncharacterised protein [Mycobacterium xenopi]|uniref:Uncharacterized protein n=1 Tax=Mycobacterium xenopi TaxID=1789 RepID=A0AAD1H437_MYCXE|nr:hypothetical protein MYXE_37920 [Mycobacterium xenopi]SPX90825.1 Uncharacterised protein [Mycobacterium xenopi]
MRKRLEAMKGVAPWLPVVLGQRLTGQTRQPFSYEAVFPAGTLLHSSDCV